MKIVVGLGNPGKEYENTKHNIGFLVLDRLAEKLNISIKKIKFKGLYGEGFVDGEKIILLKPQTYMNLSGQSVREIVDFYKIDPEDLTVIYDDLDLPMGALRIRSKGSAGTHNGMKSVVYQIQTDAFPRIRVGIGGDRKGDTVHYVISGFHGEEKDIMREAVIKAADAAECLLRDGVNEAMNRFNTKKKKKKKEEPEEGGAQPVENAGTSGAQPPEQAGAAETIAESVEAAVPDTVDNSRPAEKQEPERKGQEPSGSSAQGSSAPEHGTAADRGEAGSHEI